MRGTTPRTPRPARPARRAAPGARSASPDAVPIDVANESGAAVDELGLIGLARHVLDAMQVNPLAELSILLVDLDAMERLHVRWMDEPGPTDVMAFPMDQLEARGGPGAGPMADDEPAPA